MKTATRLLHVPELIVRKREGGTLEESEIRALIEGFVAGSVADYQMSALAMAVYFRGMTFAETMALTLAMRDSGKVVKLGRVKAPKVGKHSTGGVGDKVSICLAPIIAACGVAVPKTSGRALGHTGGTLDKLEAIPGFRVDLSIEAFRAQIRQIGLAITGQTEELAPADRRLYALRDVTGTIESIPLITASILSKKLAEGLDGLVLDVKAGRGAFMKTHAAARELAVSLVRVGRRAGTRVSALLTDMGAPIGYTVGNALETKEALALLHGEGPEDLREITFALGAEMLRIAGVTKSTTTAMRQQRKVVDDGLALAKMRAMVVAQGGDPRVVDEPDRLVVATRRTTVTAAKAGYVASVDPLELGAASMSLGAGRVRVGDLIDPGAGIVLHVRPGDRVRTGQALATLHASKSSLLEPNAQRVERSFEVRRSAPATPDPIIEIIRR